MLNHTEKTPVPEWTRCAGYVARWVQGQWIVQFLDEYEAKRGLLVLQMQKGAPRLSAAPLPQGAGDGWARWYVGVLD